MMNPDYFKDLNQTVKFALAEDVGDVDITAELIDSENTATAEVITREEAVICGQPWVDEVFRQVDPKVKIEWQINEADLVEAERPLLRVSGLARSILTAERPALNFLQTLSGTATATHRYAQLISHTNARLLDTRKTIPGLRHAQKYAVSKGGGENHRMGLYDAFLIKENHILACGSINKAINRARQLYPGRRVEVEVENLDEFYKAVEAEPDWIMLDNFPLEDMLKAVASANRGIKLEASGGIEEDDDLVSIAETGVDFVSIGALTKHCQAIDLSMRLLI
ncbi:MAG TPA: carboxylating nicotinate-nucleotide diphosphorylase [Pseudomonadales bacterium]|jgi:nicotinate-nucleotide pyrophosphorylase (carboxylating)|nr:carboxylating nicotinate-nucleotide diphosphorylase [Pseudomonadales bacterium]MDP7314898.1 carboxylating nicotinate-nucleotide diphosphorylase [Pseudomonadales bacterium]HJP49424.1 carboxylating nicotinate-nucleotide diphosphorylase [Pseudomonadales bacterium]|tara:strand:+ start:4105 stop:4947 length:843 start_codon:yes stop_codon:yes gene_type:complete